jgi:hypothetical protein
MPGDLAGSDRLACFRPIFSHPHPVRKDSRYPMDRKEFREVEGNRTNQFFNGGVGHDECSWLSVEHKFGWSLVLHPNLSHAR